jgi:hypothetical protein
MKWVCARGGDHECANQRRPKCHGERLADRRADVAVYRDNVHREGDGSAKKRCPTRPQYTELANEEEVTDQMTRSIECRIYRVYLWSP